MVGYSTTARTAAASFTSLWTLEVAAHAKALVLFALLQLSDLTTTGYGLAAGITREANPLAHSLLGNGLPTMLGAKALVVALVALLVVRLSARYKRIWAVLWVGNIFYVLVLSINLVNLVP
ncbi:MAG: DUF5658 family protein [Chloroflexota bacterium]